MYIRVIKKLWDLFSSYHGDTSFEVWFDREFPNTTMKEKTEILEALYDDKGRLWKKKDCSWLEKS